MPKSTMSALLVTFGEIRGWKGAFHAHQFRYGSGKLLNESGKFSYIGCAFYKNGLVTDLVRRVGEQGTAYVDYEAR